MAQTSAEAHDLVERVRAELSFESLNPPKGIISRVFREVEKKLTFGRGATPYALADSVGFLCAYGHYRHAVDTSAVLGAIDPQSWDIDYSYVRDAIHTSYFFAERAGDSQGASQLASSLALPGPMDAQRGRDRYVPNAYVLNGEGLGLPFENNPDVAGLGGSEIQRLGSAAVMDLRAFAPMWIFGGSAAWPRDRIMAEVDSTLVKLQNLPGWEPW